MAKPSPWLLVVQRSERITPNMQRITFGGEGLAGFPEDTASAYLKLAIPVGDSAVTRSYTVRRYDRDSGELEIDFVVHGDAGPASAWATRAAVGDRVRAGGPGPKKLLNLSGDWFLTIGDMSALPAIGANLAHLPGTARGFALIELLDEADCQQLTVPRDIELRWIVNPDPARSVEIIMDEVRSLRWPQGQCEAWVAGELKVVQAVRGYLKSERSMARAQFYASSYWQRGQTDEQHRLAKKADQDADSA